MNLPPDLIKGFSKKTPDEKLAFVAAMFDDSKKVEKDFLSFRHPDRETQHILSQISENTITNFPLPFGVAPNFLVNGNMYMLPMVVEESSVVAAASSAARFWAERGGFKAEVKSMAKKGQLHFLFRGDKDKLFNAMPALRQYLADYVKPVTEKMEARGGGILDMQMADCTHTIPHYFQMQLQFDTMDAMGANFINSCLEEIQTGLHGWIEHTEGFSITDYEPLMAILSNYNDKCLVEVAVSCTLDELEHAAPGLSAAEFARRFGLAVSIAGKDVYRATTHNKGIMNGVDALILATGNDFRAIEAGAHAWAARSGQYRSLSTMTLSDNIFRFSLEMPMAVGTVGGLTNLHPLAAKSMEILGNPSARELMMLAAAAGLANNFAAVKSLTTTGIQAGHMKMHLANIMLQLKANPGESKKIAEHFRDKKVSHSAVEAYLKALRTQKQQ